MQFAEGAIYHLYNRGNNQQPIFPYRSNYLYFLQKMRECLHPHCGILAYCLMPNHYHILLRANEKGCQLIPLSGSSFTTVQQVLSRKIGTLQSSYTQALQKQERFTGSLFQQKAKSKQIATQNVTKNDLAACFHYIHQNPLKARLVSKMEEWEYSSYRDYVGVRNGTLCNLELGMALVGMDSTTFLADSRCAIKDEVISRLLY